MDKYLIVVAGGSGTRIGSDIPKQFLVVSDKPLMMYTIEAFYQYDSAIKIIVALPVHFIDYWKKLCCDYNFNIPHRISKAGNERFCTVKAALEYIPDGAVVAIHDAVRPFVSVELIRKVFDLSLRYQAVAPALRAQDSLRMLSHPGSSTKSVMLDRNQIFLVQTPQIFHSTVLKEAYKTNYSPSFTDDLSVVEMQLGIEPHLCEGERDNIKITTPMDLIVSESIFKFKSRCVKK